MNVNNTASEKAEFIESVVNKLEHAEYNETCNAFSFFSDLKVEEELLKKYSEAEVKTIGARLSSRLEKLKK